MISAYQVLGIIQSAFYMPTHLLLSTTPTINIIINISNVTDKETKA